MYVCINAPKEPVKNVMLGIFLYCIPPCGPIADVKTESVVKQHKPTCSTSPLGQSGAAFWLGTLETKACCGHLSPPGKWKGRLYR